MKSAAQVACYGFALCLAIAVPDKKVCAGEALIIGPEKGLTEPGKKPKTENPVFGGSIGKLDAPSPYSGLTPSILPSGRSFSAKEQKRQRDAADEKANWLLLNPGELQNKDETASTFGVKEKDYSVEGLEKEDTSRNYTFRGIGKARKPTPEMLKQMQLLKQQSKEEPESAPRTESTPLSTRGVELNLKALFEPKGENAISKSGFGEPILNDLFKAPLPAVNEDSQRQHQKLFNTFIQGNSGNPLAGGNDGRGSSPLDWAKAPANNNSPLFGGATPAQTFKAPVAPVAEQNFGRHTALPNTPEPGYQQNRTFGSSFSDPPRRRGI